ncbi:CLUMA_CG005074, isoform A [Clunio marinus]|uniref:CLUMA_CG005074, isoform A n=1 Tax=Clunio marinus TaxID=568069 RepID=A0A1J1HZ52_9DIPT|nr:CLUMA_CG005074, isoform A [Clunio marinus]
MQQLLKRRVRARTGAALSHIFLNFDGSIEKEKLALIYSTGFQLHTYTSERCRQRQQTKAARDGVRKGFGLYRKEKSWWKKEKYYVQMMMLMARGCRSSTTKKKQQQQRRPNELHVECGKAMDIEA